MGLICARGVILVPDPNIFQTTPVLTRQLVSWESFMPFLVGSFSNWSKFYQILDNI